MFVKTEVLRAALKMQIFGDIMVNVYQSSRS